MALQWRHSERSEESAADPSEYLRMTQKINARSYFNSTRIAATFRAGYGNFFLFGSYNLTTVFKSQVASEISLLQAGIGITGL
jgi:hypothetical protein